MNDLLLWVMLLVIMIAVSVPFVVRSLIWNRILKLLQHGRYEEVLNRLDRPLFKIFFKEYDRDYNKLRVYLAQSNGKRIEEQTKLILGKKLTARQSYQIASQTYYYFLDCGNEEICTQLLAFIKQTATLEEVNYSTMLYRILIERKSEDIEEVEKLLHEKRIENIKKDQKEEQQVQMGILQYLLGLQYFYKKDKAKMEHYLNKAKSNLKNTPYQKKIKQLLRSS